jgi:lysophospholipase L1-like esterase
VRGPRCSNGPLTVGGGPNPGGAPSLAARYFAQGLAARFSSADLSGSNASSVSSWASRIGSYTGSGGTAPTLRTAGNSTLADGRQAVRFTSASSQYLRCDALGALFSGGAQVTIAAILRRASNHDGNLVGIHGAGSLARQHYLDNFSGAGGSPKIYNGSANPSGSLPLTRTTEDAIVFIVRNPGGTSYSWANGQRVSFSLASDANTYTGAALGAVVSSGTPANPLNADVVELCVWSRALADHDIAAATLSLGASGLIRFQVVALGDSETEGSATGGYSWFTALYTSSAWAGSTSVSQYAARTNGGRLYECTTAGTTASSGGPTGTGSGITDGTAVWRYVNDVLSSYCLGATSTPGEGINRAVSGRTLVAITGSTSNEYDNLSADITSLYNAYTPRIVFFFLGTNDKLFGASDDDAEAAFWLNIDTVRAANPHDYLVAVTPLPRGGGVDTTGLRARILAGYGAHCDAVWDAGGAANLQDVADAAMYVEAPNGVHLTVRGQTELLSTLPLASLIDAAQRKMLGALLTT